MFVILLYNSEYIWVYALVPELIIMYSLLIFLYIILSGVGSIVFSSTRPTLFFSSFSFDISILNIKNIILNTAINTKTYNITLILFLFCTSITLSPFTLTFKKSLYQTILIFF